MVSNFTTDTQLLPPSTVACEDIATHEHFRALKTIADIKVDLRYASADNFVGRDLYSPLDCAWLHEHAATALERSVAWLRIYHPNLRLCVLDALRPQRVQEALWHALDGTALHIYLANPVIGSLHSFGMAIDVTLLDVDGSEIDMGTPFDEMTARAHPALEARNLRHGTLAVAQVRNREVLRTAMAAGQWRSIDTEWWHFDGGDRQLIRATYTRVL